MGSSATLNMSVGSAVPVGATGVIVNITATGPTDTSYLTVYQDGITRPGISTVNFTPGQTVANLAIVPVTNGSIDIYNHIGSVDVIADVTGYFK